MPLEPESKKAVRKYRKDYQLFYAHLGYCINRWANIDSLMCECLQFALGTDLHRAGIIYHNITAFSFKLQLLDKLMARALSAKKDSEKLSQWKKISKAVDKQANFRNFITHQPVRVESKLYLVVDDTGMAREHSSETWWAVSTSKLEVEIGKRKPESYKLTDLLAHRYAVDDILKLTESFLLDHWSSEAKKERARQKIRAKSARRKTARRTPRKAKKSPR